MAFDAGDIEARLILDRSAFDRGMDAAERRAAEFEKKKWKATLGLDLDDSKARRDLERFKREMAGLRDREIKINARIDRNKLKKDVKDAFKDLNQTQTLKLKADIDRDRLRRQFAQLGRDLRSTVNLDAQVGRIENLKGGTASFDAKLNGAAAQAEASALARSLKRTVFFDVELNEGTVADQVNGLTGGRNRIQVDVDIDTGTARQEMSGLSESARQMGETVQEAGAVSTKSMNKFALYANIAALAVPPIGAAVAALPALLIAAGVPLAAIVVGLDGIKASATGLRVPFRELQNDVSATFQQGLEPAIANISRLMPGLNSGLRGTADSLSFMARDITNVATSSRQLDNMDENFDRTNKIIREMSPSMSGLVDNFFELGTAALRGLEPVPAMMLNVSNEWQHVIDTMSETGSAEEAVASLFSILSELLGIIAPLTQLGADFMAAWGPPLTAALAGLGGALQAVADIFSALPGPIQSVIAAMVAYRIASNLMGHGARRDAAQVALMTTAMRNAGLAGAAVGPGMVAAAAGTGRLGAAAGSAAPQAGKLAKAGSALMGVFGGGAGLAFTGAAIGLSIFGQAMAEVQQKTLDSEMAVKNYADALRASGGAITEQVVQLTAQRATTLGMDTALLKLGVTSQSLTNTLAQGGTAVDQLGASMLVGADKADGFNVVTTLMGQSMKEAGGLTGALGSGIEYLGGVVGWFGSGAGEAVNGLNQMSKEFDLGAEASKRMTAAQTALQTNLESTGQTVDRTGLSTAAWAATMEALIDPTKTVVDVTNQATSAYSLASLGARNMASANGANVGSLMQFKDVMKDINPAVIDSKGNIDLWAKGGLEMQGAALQAAQGIDQLFAATLAQTGSMAEAGAKAATARQQFIEMGVAAGVPRESMQALADSMMAIPPEVKTAVSMPGGVEAVANALGLADSIVAIPDEKTVIVKSLTEEAIATLEALGLKVEQLPDGTFKIYSDVTPADADAMALFNRVNTMNPIMGINAEDRGAVPYSEQVRQRIDELVGTEGVNAEDRGAGAQAGAIAGQISGMVGTEGVNAQDRGAGAAAGAIQGQINGMVGTEGVNAADRGATGEANRIKGFIDGLTGVENVDARDGGAMSVARGIQSAINGIVATITIVAKRVGDFFGLADGAIVQPMADGGINGLDTVTPMAQGGMGSQERMKSGMSRVTPMASGQASMVGPNSWKLVGDRGSGMEAFIPINKSARSRGLLKQAASLMGYEVVDINSMMAQAQADASGGRGAPTIKGDYGSYMSSGKMGGSDRDWQALLKKLDEVADAASKGGVNIGNVNTIDTAQNLAKEINFKVRAARRPGVHSG